MNVNSLEYIRPIHHSFVHASLSNSQIKNECNKKIINSEQFCNVEMKVFRQQESSLSIFSKRLQNSFKSKQKELSKHLRAKRHSFFKEQEVKVKQTKKILIIQQKVNNQSGFSLNVIAAKEEDRVKANNSEKKHSFQHKYVERVPLISYPVERMTGFRKKLIDFLQHQEVKKVDVFQKVNKRKSLQKRVRIQPIQGQVKTKIQTEPSNLEQSYFIVPTNFKRSKKKMEKKHTSIIEVPRQDLKSSFRRFSKQLPKEQKVQLKQKPQVRHAKQKNKENMSKTKQGQIGPWNEQVSGEQF